MSMTKRKDEILPVKVSKGWKIKKQYLTSKIKCCEKGDMFNTFQVITIVILTFVLSLGTGILISSKVFEHKKIKNDEISNFIREYDKIKDQYYKDIDDEISMKTALDAIINSLDEHSMVIDDSLSNTLNTKLQGSYQGLGIEIVNDKDNNIIIYGVIDDSPAKKAGFKPMDVIIELNGEKVYGMSTIDLTKKISESKNSEFNVVVSRDGNILPLKLKRDLVNLKSVFTKIYEKNNKKVGYIHISIFAYNTDIQFREKLKDLESKKIDSLIIDLRNNTGGHLTAVENMMSEFLDKRHVIYQIQQKENIKKYYSKTNDKREYPIVVLVNEYSASASEMFAAAMQEEYKAIIMGITTYGKGTVQEVYDSNMNNEEYKLTTKKWLTPKGKWINEKGVKPNIEVKLNNIDSEILTDKLDNQLQEAISLLAK